MGSLKICPSCLFGQSAHDKALSPYLDIPLVPPGAYLGEEHCKVALQATIGTFPNDSTSMTQSSLQADLDQQQFDELLEASNMYDKSRLLTLSNNNHTSAWPLVPSAEFSIAARIWLGVPSFQSSPSPLCHHKFLLTPTVTTSSGVVTVHLG